MSLLNSSIHPIIAKSKNRSLRNSWKFWYPEVNGKSNWLFLSTNKKQHNHPNTFSKVDYKQNNCLCMCISFYFSLFSYPIYYLRCLMKVQASESISQTIKIRKQIWLYNRMHASFLKFRFCFLSLVAVSQYVKHRLLINDDTNKKNICRVFWLLESQLKIRCNMSIRYRLKKLSNPCNALKQLFLSAIELDRY